MEFRRPPSGTVAALKGVQETCLNGIFAVVVKSGSRSGRGLGPTSDSGCGIVPIG
jgi:hypothetical protein